MQLVKIISIKNSLSRYFVLIQSKWMFPWERESFKHTWKQQTIALCMQREGHRELKVLRNGTFVLAYWWNKLWWSWLFYIFALTFGNKGTKQVVSWMCSTSIIGKNELNLLCHWFGYIAHLQVAMILWFLRTEKEVVKNNLGPTTQWECHHGHRTRQ